MRLKRCSLGVTCQHAQELFITHPFKAYCATNSSIMWYVTAVWPSDNQCACYVTAVWPSDNQCASHFSSGTSMRRQTLLPRYSQEGYSNSLPYPLQALVLTTVVDVGAPSELAVMPLWLAAKAKVAVPSQSLRSRPFVVHVCIWSTVPTDWVIAGWHTSCVGNRW